MDAIKYKFNSKKTLNLLLYISSKLKRRDFHKIFKILYFADREFMNAYGMPITGDTYIAMDAGPVPSKTYDMLKIVRGDSYMKDLEGLHKFFKINNWMYVQPLQEPDMKAISPAEIEIIDEVIKLYGSLSYDEIKEKSHDTAWRSTARDFPISFENMALEAGIDDEDLPYLQETAELQNTFC